MQELHKRITFEGQGVTITVWPAHATIERARRKAISIEGHVLPCLMTLLEPHREPAISFIRMETVGTGIPSSIDFATRFPLPFVPDWETRRQMRSAAAHIAAYFADILLRQIVYGSADALERHLKTLIAYWHQADERLLHDGQRLTVRSGLVQYSEVVVLRETGRRMPIWLRPFGLKIQGAPFRAYEIECFDLAFRDQPPYIEERTEPQLLLEYAHGVYSRSLAL